MKEEEEGRSCPRNTSSVEYEEGHSLWPQSSQKGLAKHEAAAAEEPL